MEKFFASALGQYNRTSPVRHLLQDRTVQRHHKPLELPEYVVVVGMLAPALALSAGLEGLISIEPIIVLYAFPFGLSLVNVRYACSWLPRFPFMHSKLVRQGTWGKVVSTSCVLQEPAIASKVEHP